MKHIIREGPNRKQLETALFAPQPDTVNLYEYDDAEDRTLHQLRVSSVCRGDAENPNVFIVRGTHVSDGKPATYTGDIVTQTGTLFVDS